MGSLLSPFLRFKTSNFMNEFSHNHLSTILPQNLSTSERARVSQAIGGMRLWIGESGLGLWAGLFTSWDWPKDLVLVCDNQTWEVLARQLAVELSGGGFNVTLLNLGSRPKANESMVGQLVNAAQSAGALVGVGSGTIGDLCKYASFILQKPYAICGTAPSMNGYLSANAAITIGGHKKSMAAHLPSAVAFDLSILKNAPARLIASGVGDSLCRSTAQSDWLLSHLLLDTPYDLLPYTLLAPYEEPMWRGDMAALIKTLLLSGLGMTLAGGSYPASQGEHLIAHYMDMLHPDTSNRNYHGEQIGVATLYMAERQEKVLSQPTSPQIKYIRFDEKEFRDKFGHSLGRQICNEYYAKLELIGNRDVKNRRLVKNWDDIRESISKISVVPVVLEEALEKAIAPRSYDELGWTAEQWMESVSNAHLIRNRFTFLDLVDRVNPHFNRHPQFEKGGIDLG